MNNADGGRSARCGEPSNFGGGCVVVVEVMVAVVFVVVILEMAVLVVMVIDMTVVVILVVVVIVVVVVVLVVAVVLVVMVVAESGGDQSSGPYPGASLARITWFALSTKPEQPTPREGTEHLHPRPLPTASPTQLRVAIKCVYLVLSEFAM